jgi:hypothetical protein
MPTSSEELKRAGRLAPRLVLPGCDWVHRRVQRVSYLEPQLMVNSLSVDFTVPEADIGAYVPISVLPKWPPLYRFDFTRADGTPVPLLTSRQNGIIDEALLEALVDEVSPNSLAKPGFRQSLSSLARGPETHLEWAFDAFQEGLEGSISDPRVERVLDIAAMLTDATLLWFPVSIDERGAHRLCKVQYLARSIESHNRRTRVLRSLSWSQPAEYIPLWHVGADANFHAEVEAPAVLAIRSVEARFYWFAETGEPGEGQAESSHAPEDSSAEAESVGLRPDEYVDREGRLAHLYVSGRRPLAADLVAVFAPSRVVVFSMFAAAAIISALVSVFYYWRAEITAPGDLDAAVAVLILVPALIGYVVIRPSDPPLARRYVFGAQLLSLAAGAIPLAMAVLLLRFSAEPSCLHTAWLWAMRASWLIAACLGVSFLRAGVGSAAD